MVQAALPMLLLAFAASSAFGRVNVTGKRDKLNGFPLYEQTSNEVTDAEAPGASINLPSCYRSTQEQARICAGMGCPGGCAGRCAPPGRSNHQHYPTCDWQGLPGDVKKGCEILLKVCQKIKARSQGVGCEIGGYGGGAHHLAAGPGVKNNAYNQCAHLKDAVQQEPPKEDLNKLKDDSDKEFQDTMGNQAQGPQSSPGGGGGASPGRPASYPSDNRSGWSDTPHGATSPTPKSNPRAPASKDSGEDTADPSRKIGGPGIGPGVGNPLSNITRRGWDKLPEAGASGYEGGSPARGSAAPGAGGGEPRAGAPAANELLSGFGSPSLPTASGAASGYRGGGASGRGGPAAALGSGSGDSAVPAIAGAETDALVKKQVDEFARQIEAGSAQSAGEGAGSEEGESLFLRVHKAHERCLQGGCVTIR